MQFKSTISAPPKTDTLDTLDPRQKINPILGRKPPRGSKILGPPPPAGIRIPVPQARSPAPLGLALLTKTKYNLGVEITCVTSRRTRGVRRRRGRVLPRREETVMRSSTSQRAEASFEAPEASP